MDNSVMLVPENENGSRLDEDRLCLWWSHLWEMSAFWAPMADNMLVGP